MLKAYKYKIKPNQQQEELLSRFFGCVRYIYNWGPAVNEPLWKGNCGYHMRTGIHDVTEYDWQAYIGFANLHLKR